MAMEERGRRAGARLFAAWALVLVALAFGVGPAVASSPSATDRSAQVQAMLDHVLGPGHSVVEIAATVRAGSGSISSVRWGKALPGGVAAFQVRTALGTSSGSSQVDAVDRTTTVLAEPPGALVRQTIAVAVDRRAMKGIPLHRLRRLIGAAAGLTRARGDQLFLLETTFPRVPATTAATHAWTDDLVPLAVPAIEIGGGVTAALILAVAVHGRRPRSRDLGRS